jgi:hypothetical protein
MSTAPWSFSIVYPFVIQGCPSDVNYFLKTLSKLAGLANSQKNDRLPGVSVRLAIGLGVMRLIKNLILF